MVGAASKGRPLAYLRAVRPLPLRQFDEPLKRHVVILIPRRRW